jgi:heptosyltransferase-3
VPRLLAGPQAATETLAAHPGSGSDRKNWPEDKWAELLKRVAAQTRCRLLLVGGEADQERVTRLSKLFPADRLEVAFNEPLPALAKRLAACGFFVGHDSGITHLAAAVGLHGLALWGDTNPAVWRPRSERIEMLSAEGGLASLGVDLVYQRLGAGVANGST